MFTNARPCISLPMATSVVSTVYTNDCGVFFPVKMYIVEVLHTIRGITQNITVQCTCTGWHSARRVVLVVARYLYGSCKATLLAGAQGTIVEFYSDFQYNYLRGMKFCPTQTCYTRF